MTTTPTPELPALPSDIDALQALVRTQREHIAELEQQLAWFKVHYRLAQQRRFAASSERCAHQLDLFADLLEEALEAAQATAAPLPDENNASDEKSSADKDQDKTKRRRGGRQPLPANLPRERVIHDLPEEEKACPILLANL